MISLPLLSYVATFCSEYLGIYSYQNYIELSVFIVAVYKTNLWLKQDHTKHLLLMWYAYFFTMSLSYYFECNTLFWAMLFGAPIIFIFCIIAHQKQLQKNFVIASTKHITPQTIPDKNWLEILIRSCLVNSYQKKNIMCIIQRTDMLEGLLYAPYMLNIAIQQEIIDLLFASSTLRNPTILWVDSSGIISSLNVTWKETITEEVLYSQNDITPHLSNHEAAIVITKKTDAFVFLIDIASNQNILWYQGKAIHKITIEQLLKSCKEIMHQTKPVESTNSKGTNYDQKSNSSSTPPTLH